jgi:hypothetical protein
MVTFKRFVFAAFAALAIGVGVVFLIPAEKTPSFNPGALSIGNVTLAGPSYVEAAARSLGLPPGSLSPRNIKNSPAEGTMPEAVTYDFETQSDRNAVLSYYQQSCRKIGLASPPPPAELALQPKLLCSGAYKGTGVALTVTPTCKASRCTVFLEISG